ncbi:S41 family peptidase [Labedaea rhizosphaerae]|uniref:Tricorn protease homolog n=1 Tax=Labedaea rhizosphaerae TaxID=598644 RepID=A0A4R6SK33_LABRH|nr:S41 family peptidase [Labedaea rhizosphaerae]TDQ04267.1 tricorn protease [Labedaea rhizosphaerae]
MTDAYLRYPDVHDGLITFVAEDDVWLAELDGGRAWRVSADHTPVRFPRFSPDGSQIAWTSTRDVEPEVHVAPVDGGPSRRLTYWGDVKTDVRGWTPDGEVVATTSTGQASTRRTWAHAVPLDGAPRQLPYGPVRGVAYGPGGAVLVETPHREPAEWKRYRGGTAGKFWLDRDGSGDFARILTDLDTNLTSPMWVGERIAFLSDHEGVGNLYSCLPDGSDLRTRSRHEFYARNAATDGTKVIYHCAGDLWLLDRLDAEPRKLDVRLGGPRTSRVPYPIDAADELGDLAPDHTGRASAIEVRGTVHWLTHRDGPVRVLAAEPGVRARLPRVLGDTGKAVWVTDAEGEDGLEVAPVDGSAVGEQPHRLATGQLGRVLELAAAPDGATVAVTTHDRRLVLVDVESGAVRELVRAEESDVSGPVFSPDSRWVAWSHPGPDPLRHIRIARIDEAEPVIADVTPLRFCDYAPAFTADGKHLVFLSARSFDPVYDTHVFDLSFLSGSRPYLVPLGEKTPSPFAPQRDGRPVSGDDDKDDKDDKGDKGDKDDKPEKPEGSEKSEKSDDAPPATEVDVELLAERVVPFPVPADNYTDLLAVSGGVVWQRQQVAGVLGEPDAPRPKPVLERYDFAKRHTDELLDGFEEVRVSGDGERLVVRQDGRVRVVPTAHKVGDDDSDDEVKVDLSRVRVTVHPPQEWRQAYDETGRLMRDHYWRADMNGVDWAGVLDRYRPLLDAVGSYDDLIDLLWEVQGELGTSHAYAFERDEDVESRRRLGLLGADLTRDDDGTWRVARVLPSETSDPRARSPLYAPGVAMRPGDAIVAVDARPVTDAGPAPLLVGAAGKPVELTVAPADGGERRRVVVVPLLDDVPLRYQAWVNERRAYVRSASGGRLGYLHVPDMQAPGWAQLHRDLRMETRCDGLIVDVRENGGGHLSQLVVEKLARKVIGWQLARDGYMVGTYPEDAPRGPVVAVTDQNAGSDGDIVTWAIRTMKIGPVVGERTWGGVIGIDMRYHLVDGTVVTQPRYASWLSGPGWGVENYGVDPDVEVVMRPQDYAAQADPQLDKAIELALAALEEQPAAVPPELPPPGVA